MNIRIGTSGFQYAEWKGKFYPERMPPAKMLAFYAEHFSTTEINYTFRRIPGESTLEKWWHSTPENFSFALKAPQSITHWAKLKECEDTVRRFCKVAATLKGKLGPILFQLPPNLAIDLPLLEDFLGTLPPGQAAFEFRHESWFSDAIFTLLKKHNVALCVAQNADSESPFIATADFGYLRLRRDDYSSREITHWAAQIAAQKWKAAHVYFKHEDEAIGPAFAIRLKEHFPV